ncbi:MAG: aminopeptidase [Candidatus Thermoplasmatota archaeon]|nr:aminopeptidase [Candidatus Thermoplasmatota archaeon]
MDLSAGATSLVETSLGVKKGELVMVLVDEPKTIIGQAFLQACRHAGAQAFMTVVDVSSAGVEPPEPVASAMKECDAVIMATTHSVSHTKARRAANRGGTRVISIPGISEDMLSQGCLLADHQEVEELMSRAYKKLRKADQLRITTAGGTNLTLRVKGRSWITEDTGLCRTRGDFATFPAGELLVAPLEGSAEGTLVVDVFFQAFLKAPATVTVREGYAVRAEGASDAEAAMDGGGHEGRHLSRLGIGFNPEASLRSTALEASKVMGSIHMGFGDNAALGGEVTCGVEVDAILKSASLEADEKPILDRGRLA